jgi:signal transduction histidine kinase
MRLGIKGKQVLGVTTIVGVVVVIVSVLQLAQLARVNLAESRARAELLARAIFHRARAVVVEGADAEQALKNDPGLRSILESSLYSNNVTFSAIADFRGVAVVHADRAQEGEPLVRGGDLDALIASSSIGQLRAIFAEEGRNYEYRLPLLVDDVEFGAIRIGVSTLLIGRELTNAMQPAVVTALIALTIAVFGAMVLAQLLLRPIHVIRSGLTRLGRGEFGVRLDLNQRDEFGELGTFFNTVSAQLSADRSQMAGQMASLETAVQHLEDAVAIVSPKGDLLFANQAMQTVLPGAAAGVMLTELVPGDHPLARLAEQTLASRQPRGPISASFSAARGEPSERLILTHPVNDARGALVGIMLIVRNLEYLSQVQSTIRYSRKLAALGRLSAGVAHEVKNPLNAMMIHLELLRQQFVNHTPIVERRAAATAGVATTAAMSTAAPAPVNATAALQHVDVIAAEIRRLDEVVQGFLKFSRPEDLKLQPVALPALVNEVVPIVTPEAARTNVALSVECADTPDVNGDPAMLRQAFLNLALNACQAMPNGGTLRIRCEAVRGRRVAITFSDTGVGIKPEHLQRIFDLYFTTRERGSGIGLSMVYRTVQMHDGEIEVESTPGKGTTFRVLLPQA